MRKRQLDECVSRAIKSLDKHPMWDHPKKPKFFHYAFLYQSGTEISFGYNHFGKVPKSYHEDSLTHAEVHAYSRAKRKLDIDKPFEVFNVRLSRSGEVKMSKPCECCHHFLTELGCNRVYFTTECGIARMLL